MTEHESAVDLAQREASPPALEAGLNVSTGRLEAFSDGVFAIAMTLLVLTLQIPRLPPPLQPGALGPRVLAMWPNLGYALCFVAATVVVHGATLMATARTQADARHEHDGPPPSPGEG